MYVQQNKKFQQMVDAMVQNEASVAAILIIWIHYHITYVRSAYKISTN